MSEDSQERRLLLFWSELEARDEEGRRKGLRLTTTVDGSIDIALAVLASRVASPRAAAATATSRTKSATALTTGLARGVLFDRREQNECQ